MILPPKKICIKDSPGKGRGVFATESISAGEVIELSYIKILNPVIEHLDTHCYSFPKWSKTPEYNFLPFGYGIVYNHSDEANSDWECDGTIMKIYATRDIEAGEECCITYNPFFWEATETKKI